MPRLNQRRTVWRGACVHFSVRHIPRAAVTYVNPGTSGVTWGVGYAVIVTPDGGCTGSKKIRSRPSVRAKSYGRRGLAHERRVYD